MISYKLRTTSKAAAIDEMINANIAYYRTYSPGDVGLVARAGYNFLHIGPDMVITEELDAEGAQMWAEVPDTWTTTLQSDVALTQATIDLLLPGTVTLYVIEDDGWTGPAATAPDAPAV